MLIKCRLYVIVMLCVSEIASDFADSYEAAPGKRKCSPLKRYIVIEEDCDDAAASFAIASASSTFPAGRSKEPSERVTKSGVT